MLNQIICAIRQNLPKNNGSIANLRNRDSISQCISVFVGSAAESCPPQKNLSFFEYLLLRRLPYAVILPAAMVVGLLGAVSCSSENATTGEQPNDSNQQDLPGKGITVRPSNSDWIEEQFTTEVVNIGFEALGYTVADIQQADYAVIHVSLANGDMDFTTGFYKVGHDAFFENAGGEEKLEKLGALVVGSGQQRLMIDKATAEQYQLSDLTQLSDPEIAALFDTDGDGKANLAGCQVGWGCNEIIEHFIQTYDLADTLEQDQGAYTVLLADVISRYKQGKPILFYTYSPHWILLELEPETDIVPLGVPFTSLPGELKDFTEEETTVGDKNLGFPIAEQMILASQQFVDENPVAKRWLELVDIPVEAMNAESLRIQNGEDTPEDIRRHAEAWVKENQPLFESWLDQARNAA